MRTCSRYVFWTGKVIDGWLGRKKNVPRWLPRCCPSTEVAHAGQQHNTVPGAIYKTQPSEFPGGSQAWYGRRLAAAVRYRDGSAPGSGTGSSRSFTRACSVWLTGVATL